MFVCTFFYNTINRMCVYLIRQYRHRQKSSLSESGLLRRHIAPLLHNRLLHFSRIGLGPFYTGCLLNIVFFSKDFRIFRTLVFLCFPLVSMCVHTHQAGRTPALQQNWQSSEKSQNFKEKTQ